MGLFQRACWLAALACAGTCAIAADNASTPTDIRFRDFFASPIGPRGLQINPSLQAANGKHVRLTGYMVAQEDSVAGRFLLTPMPIRMSEHADGEADDLPPATVAVEMPLQDRARLLPHTPGLLQLTGVLQVGRHELPDGRIVWVRLLLDPKS